jgi:tetratricopeptide (TPR) repeat protein
MVQRIRRIVASPFTALFFGISTAWELILIALVIVDAKMDPEKKQFLDQDHVKVLLRFPRRPRRVDLNRAVGLQRLAGEAKAGGDLKRAIRLYDRAIRHTPYNAALFLLRGSVLLEANRPKDAAKDFVAGLELDPGNQTLTFLMHTANAKAAEQAVSAKTYPQTRALRNA